MAREVLAKVDHVAQRPMSLVTVRDFIETRFKPDVMWSLKHHGDNPARGIRMPWLSWHVFRHTHATLGEQIGMALSDRQAQMGHGDVRMTLHYTHADIERRRRAIETMADRLVGESAA